MACHTDTLLQRAMLVDLYQRLDEEGRRELIQVLCSSPETLPSDLSQRLEGIETQLRRNRHSFTQDLLANVTGNAIFDGAVAIGKALLTKIKM